MIAEDREPQIRDIHIVNFDGTQRIEAVYDRGRTAFVEKMDELIVRFLDGRIVNCKGMGVRGAGTQSITSNHDSVLDLTGFPARAEGTVGGFMDGTLRRCNRAGLVLLWPSLWADAHSTAVNWITAGTETRDGLGGATRRVHINGGEFIDSGGGRTYVEPYHPKNWSERRGDRERGIQDLRFPGFEILGWRRLVELVPGAGMPPLTHSRRAGMPAPPGGREC